MVREGTVSAVRWVEVAPERMPRWLAGFAERHGGQPDVTVEGSAVTFVAPDGATAQCHPPPGAEPARTADDLARPVTVPIGLLLARRGGYAVGLVEGQQLVASKVDSRYVQSRTAAGGWSQQRFARRRDNQAKAAAQEAAGECVRLLLPAVDRLAALVTGGDRQHIEAILADARLGPLKVLRVDRFLPVPDPKRSVLEQAVTSARSVQIRVD
jgi:hypothetical protein